jgi:hypothetical protein
VKPTPRFRLGEPNAAGIFGVWGSLITTSIRCLGSSGHVSADLGERSERTLKSA